MKNNNIEIRRLHSEEIPAALDLCLQVFMQFEAPEYPQEGIQAFRAVLNNAEWIGKMDFYGAVDNGLPIGVLAMRSPQHIGLFFVRAENQHKGIGRALFEAMRQNYTVQEFTVNASPYAVKIYEHLGFIPTAAEQLTDGIRYTPMLYKKEKIRQISI